MKKIKEELKQCNTFHEYLSYIRDTEGLKMLHELGWYWLEYNGEEVDGTSGELFTKQSEMDDLLRLAGLS